MALGHVGGEEHRPGVPARLAAELAPSGSERGAPEVVAVDARVAGQHAQRELLRDLELRPAVRVASRRRLGSWRTAGGRARGRRADGDDRPGGRRRHRSGDGDERAPTGCGVGWHARRHEGGGVTRTSMTRIDLHTHFRGPVGAWEGTGQSPFVAGDHARGTG